MNTYTLFWLTGESEIVQGDGIAKAMTLAGYSNGAVRALDFYSEGDIREQYKWYKKEKAWISTLS